MLRKVSRFKPVPVDRFDRTPQHCREASSKHFELIVKRVIMDFLIEIAHQVNQATLLTAIDCIVGCVKIRYKNPCEIFEHARQKGALPGTPVEIKDRTPIRNAPNVTSLRTQIHISLIDIDN